VVVKQYAREKGRIAMLKSGRVEMQVVAHRIPEDRGTDTKARPDRTATDVRLDTGPMRE
jgi:hypothetical protein